MVVYKTTDQVLSNPNVRKYLPENCKWWTNYIYHFSHVTNIAKILNDGLMVSRNIYENMKDPILNDNAGKEVIDSTGLDIKDYVRFYLRPLTPTQFHNEGIRSKREIELSKYGAHCPIPIFLFFDNSILDEEYTYFSYESLASNYPVDIYQGVEKLSQAPFNLIYHCGQIEGDVSTIVKHRHAEVVIKDTHDLSHLSRIVCRNIEEANTLLDLLSEEALSKFENLIYIVEENEINQVFNNAYLNITSVTQTKTRMEMKFSRNDLFLRDIKMQWVDSDGNQVCHYNKKNTHLSNPYVITMENFLNNYSTIKFQMKLDEKLVYSKTFEL